MAALLIGYAVAIAIVFFAGLSQSIDRATKHGDRPSSADGEKDGKSRSTGEIDGFSVAQLFRAYRCRNFCFHVCLVGRDARRIAANIAKPVVAVAAVTLSNQAILRRAIRGYSRSSCRCHNKPPPQR
jgi:uncharacterized RDD family membrane protein YckC